MARFANPLQRAARIEKILEREPFDDALHFAPPSKRELRTQAVHRLQVGLLGLSAILLLIALASAISSRIAEWLRAKGLPVFPWLAQ